MNVQDTTLAAGQGGDDARPDDAATTQNPATEPAPGADIPYEDPEAAELAAARAAVEAEDKGETQGPGAQPQQEAQPTAPAAAPDQTQQQGQQQQPRQPGPVPYDRFAKVAQRTRTLEEENAFLKGALEVLRHGQQPGQQPPANGQPGNQPAPAAPAPDSPEAIIAAAEQRAMQAAEQFDRGEITAVELSRIQMAAARDLADAQVQTAIRRQAPAPAPVESVTDQMVMEAHVTELEAKNPVLKVLTKPQLSFLQQTAEAEAAAAGQAYRPGPRDTMRLREHVARLANAFAPHWGLQVPAAAPAPASNGSNPPARQPGLSPAAQNRLGKMDMAAGLPPDTARMGQPAAGSGELTDAQILAMSDDDLAALPPTTRARLLTM